MKHIKKIISKLPLVDLNGLDWTVEPEQIFIQSYLLEVISGTYTLEIDTYLEMIDERVYAVPNKVTIYEDTENGYALIDLSDEDYESLCYAINDVMQ